MSVLMKIAEGTGKTLKSAPALSDSKLSHLTTFRADGRLVGELFTSHFPKAVVVDLRTDRIPWLQLNYAGFAFQ